MTLTGTGFDNTAANNIVFFGATRASVTAASATSVTVTVPTGATYEPITLLNTATGLATASRSSFNPVYSPVKTFGATDLDAKVDFTTGSSPYSIAIGDLDGDGKPDLAVANSSSNTVSVFRNTSSSGSISSGSFAAKVDFTTSTNPYSLAIGDLDLDGKLDLAVVCASSNTLSILRNTSTSGSISSGSFAAKVDITTNSYPVSVAIGDLDLDGKPDLAVANTATHNVSAFRNTSTSGSITSGSFAKVDFNLTGYMCSPSFVAIGDLDGDGKPELVVTKSYTSNLSILRNTSTSGSISSSSFATDVVISAGSSPSSLAIGDVDGDGKADLAVVSSGASNVSIYRNTSTSGSITSGSFAARVVFTTGSSPREVAIGDLDGNGKPDLAVVNNGGNSVSVLLNTSTSGSITSGSFASKLDFTTGSSPYSIAIGDLDGDGKPDLAVANNGSSTLSVLRNSGSSCTNPSSGGTIATAQSGSSPFDPAAFTSSADASGHTGTLEYKWQSSTTSSSSGFSDISGATSATYDPGALTQTTWFKRLARVSCQSDWTGAAESNVLQVTVTVCVNPTSGGTIGSAQSGNSPFDPSSFTSSAAASGHTGTLEYKWQSSTTSSSSGFSDISGATSATYDPGALTQTTWFKRLARVSCQSDWTGAAESNVLQVTVTVCVNPTSGGTIAAAQSGNSPFDPSAFTSSAAASGHTGTLEYKWQSSTTSSSAGFSDISGATSATYDPGALTQTTWFKRLARVSCQSDWTGAAESNVLQVTVTPVKNWTGGTGNWNVGANWSGGTVPVSSDAITITSGNPKLNVDFTVSGSLTISGTGGLTVEPGKTLTVSGTADFGGKTVTFRSDATGTAQLGNLTGTLTGASNVTVERFIPATGRRWRLLTAPLTGITINSAWQKGQTWNGTATLTSDGTGTLITGQQPGTAANANSKGFDFWSAVSNSSASIMSYGQRSGQGVWEVLANTTTANAFNNGQGYLLFVRGPRGSGFSTGTANAATTLSPTGTLRQGEISTTVDGTKGYTVVGNPYASQIDFNAVYQNSGNSAVIKRQFWMWDATSGASGNWQAVIYSVDKYVEVPAKFHTAGQATPLTSIQSGHAFMVAPLSATGGTLKIRESNKVAAAAASPNILLSNDRTPRVFVNLVRIGDDGNEVVSDGVMVAYGRNWRMQTTDMEDVLKMDNPEENLAVVNEGSNWIAEARPVSDLRPVDLRTWNLQTGGYRLEARIDGMQGLGVRAYLEDRLTGSRTELKSDGTVSTVSFVNSRQNLSSAEDRFRIVFESASVKANLTQEIGGEDIRALNVYPNPLSGRSVTVRLNRQPAGAYSLQLVGVDGRLLKQQRVDHEGGSATYRFELGGAIPSGSYQLRCVNGERPVGIEKLVLQ